MGNHISHACSYDGNTPPLSRTNTNLVIPSWSHLIIWLCLKGHGFISFIWDLPFFFDEKLRSLFLGYSPWFSLSYPLLIAFWFSFSRCLHPFSACVPSERHFDYAYLSVPLKISLNLASGGGQHGTDGDRKLIYETDTHQCECMMALSSMIRTD